ncbi:DUF1178 family protein [Hansschlegelia zhihuaiae]|uniref:DUF1178 family protein n=1 Tax=Hansschlegelia zhihuaiae TaxID=405005 RepID=A0A4Q0MDD4_9HYPH|nr:DUF1178 family protein [Hansschlegelia zhihuaiae]RXF70816.1 DUF1178 family protein [Hansschlegelia zhihuaiae]
MIRYSLVCDAGHGFDGWFRSSGDFDAQAGGGLLSCPSCGSAKIGKALMAPSVRLKGAAEPAGTPAREELPASAPDMSFTNDREQKLRGMLRELRAHMTKNSEDVGEKFPEIARKMHAEEIERRTVHGKATAEEAKALVEEGVAIQPLPTFPDEMN